jgi:hypothetical protein
MTRAALMLSVVLLLLSAACASTPESQAPLSAPADCAQLSAAIRAAQDERRVAVETRDGAWKAVLPVAVVGRYVMGSSQADAADRRFSALSNLAAANGCTH